MFYPPRGPATRDKAVLPQLPFKHSYFLRPLLGSAFDTAICLEFNIAAHNRNP